MNQTTPTKKLKCPVCSSSVDPSSDDMHCPICSADLTTIRRLRELGLRFYNEALILLDKSDDDRAVEKLMSALQYHDDPAAVRVLAGKILHKNGRYDEAADQWRQAAGEGSSEAEALVRAAGNATRSRRVVRIGIHASVYCLLLIALAFSLHYAAGLRDQSRQYAAQVTASRSKAPLAQASAKAQSEELDSLARLLAKDGDLIVERKSGMITVLFREGLFGNASDRLDGDSSARLRSVADAVRRYGKPCRVEIAGCTNSLPLKAGSYWGSGWDLGLARATAAADCMGWKFPDSRIQWSVCSAGDRTFPFPNDGQDNRNRTVIVRVRE